MEDPNLSSVEPVEGSLMSLKGVDELLVDQDVGAVGNEKTNTPFKSATHEPC